jgi:ligand-binding sensor domain-containing protein
MILRCLFVCLFFSVRLAYGNDNYLVEYIGIERGLSNNAVTCIYQDHHGFMWFGTYDGLNRYDGYSFKVFRNVIGESNSLRDNHIYAIEEDASYNLWVGGIKGISIYNPVTSRFSIPHIFSWNKKGLQVLTEGVGVIRSVNKGEYLLAGTQDRGLIVFDKNSTVGTQVPLYDRKGQEGNYGVAAIEIDPSGKYAWVFVHDAGLYRYDIKAKTLTAVSRVVPYSYCLEMNGKENIWVGNNNGLYKYNISTASYSAAIPFKHRIVSLFEDRNRVLWIASDGGGVWYLTDGSSTPVPYLSNGVPVVNSNAVYAIYEDAEERKWIGTLRGGINLIHPRKNSFTNVTYNGVGENNVINNFILSFCQDNNNNIWIGTDGAGLRYWDRNKNTYRQYIHNAADKNSITSNFITGVLRDSDNNLWVSTWFGGINRLKGNSQSFEHYKCFNPRTGQDEYNTWFMYEDRNKKLWASTTNNGTLYIYN